RTASGGLAPRTADAGTGAPGRCRPLVVPRADGSANPVGRIRPTRLRSLRELRRVGSPPKRGARRRKAVMRRRDAAQYASLLRPTVPVAAKTRGEEIARCDRVTTLSRLVACRLRVGQSRRESIRVSGIGAGKRHIGRRLVSCLVAYAFALQMLLFAFAAPAVAGLTSDEEALAPGLRLHDQSAPPPPQPNPRGDRHSKRCPAGGPA